MLLRCSPINSYKTAKLTKFVKVPFKKMVTILCIMLIRESLGLISQGFVRTTAVLQIPMGILFFLPLFGFTSGAIRGVMGILRAKYPNQNATTLEDIEADVAATPTKEV